MVAIVCSILLCVPASRGGRTGRPYGLRSARNMRIQVTPECLAGLSNPPFRGTCTLSSGKTEPPCTSGRPAHREPPRWQPMVHRRPQFRTRASGQDPPMRRGCRDPMEEPWPGTPLHPPPVHPRMGFGAFARRMGSPESSASLLLGTMTVLCRTPVSAEGTGKAGASQNWSRPDSARARVDWELRMAWVTCEERQVPNQHVRTTMAR